MIAGGSAVSLERMVGAAERRVDQAALYRKSELRTPDPAGGVCCASIDRRFVEATA